MSLRVALQPPRSNLLFDGSCLSMGFFWLIGDYVAMRHFAPLAATLKNYSTNGLFSFPSLRGRKPEAMTELCKVKLQNIAIAAFFIESLLPYIFTAKPAKCAKKTFKSLRSSRS